MRSGAYLAIVVLTAASGRTAHAEEVPQVGGLEEVVVTAERRTSTVQTTPVAISAFTQDSLDRAGLVDADALARKVPSMSFGGAFATPRITLRGIGTENVLGGSVGGDPGVAIYTDGVVMARPQGAVVPFFDLERIEVLRGPQGTLYGRNAIGGAINIITAMPTPEFEGALDAQVGNRSSHRVRAALGGPLFGDRLMFRVSGYSEQAGADVRNVGPGGDLGDRDVRAGRIHFLTKLGEDAELLLSADYYRHDNTPPTTYRGNVRDTPEGRALLGRAPDTAPELTAGERLGGRLVSDERTVNLDFAGYDRRTIWGTSARFKLGVTEHAELTALAGYRETKTDNTWDLDGTEVAVSSKLAGVDTTHQFSGELQLASRGERRLDWIAGAYFFSERGRNDQTFALSRDVFTFLPPGGLFQSGGVIDTQSYALFGQATFRWTDTFRSTVGVRWSHDQKDGDEYLVFGFPVGTARLGKSWSAFTPRLTLEYDVSPDMHTYVSAARGYKSGGINVGALQGSVYDPEYVTSYELGVKSEWFDRRLRANVAAFFYDYKDLQLNQLLGFVQVLTNAAKSRIKGVELELTAAPWDALQLDLTASYLDASFSSFANTAEAFPELGVLDLSGNPLPRSPRLKVDGGAQYTLRLPGDSSLTLRADASHTSRVYFNEFKQRFASQAAVSQLNARVSWQDADGRLSVAAYGTNLTDREVVGNALIEIAAFGFDVVRNINAGRRYGIEFAVRY